MFPQFRRPESVGQFDLRHHVASDQARRRRGSAGLVRQDDERRFDHATGAPFTPLELFVMELFRTISPNGGSISAVEDARRSSYGESPHTLLDARFQRYGYMDTPHTSTSFDPVHWSHPQQFDPDRYKTVPTSDQIDEAKCKQIGFARCPFDITTSMSPTAGRRA